MHDDDFLKLLVAAAIASGKTPAEALAIALDTIQLMYGAKGDE